MVSSRQPPNQVPTSGIGTPSPLANTRAQNTTSTTSAPTAFHSNLKNWLAAALTRHSTTSATMRPAPVSSSPNSAVEPQTNAAAFQAKPPTCSSFLVVNDRMTAATPNPISSTE